MDEVLRFGGEIRFFASLARPAARFRVRDKMRPMICFQPFYQGQSLLPRTTRTNGDFLERHP